MGHMDHASFGWLTPTLSYVMACVGSALGLRCTVRALATTGPSRRNWLITAASALGTGIWTMHFVAMLGFGVSGTEIRYNVPLTVLSLIVAMLVVGAGVFAVGYGKKRARSLALGGLTTGLGVASMHYLGMAAVRLHGRVGYDPWLVALSVLIAVAAATAALWAALTIHRPVVVSRRVPGHGRGREQHALHGNVRGTGRGPPLGGGTARRRSDRLPLPARGLPRLVPLPHLRLRRAVPNRQGTRCLGDRPTAPGRGDMTTQRDRDTTVPRGRRAHAGLPADETPQRPALASAVSDRGPVPHLRPGPRLALRPKSVRAKIVSVLMVPVVSLMALWAFAAVTTAQEVSGQLRAQRVDRSIRQPVTATVTALQAERRAAARYLAAPSAARAA